MLGDGEGVADSILILIEEQEMVEGRLIDRASARGHDGVEKPVSQWGREKREPRALWRWHHAKGDFYTTGEGEIRRQSGG
jgi:hypothetical protein